MNIPNQFNNFYPAQMYRPANMNNGINWVQGVEGAKAFQLSPNSNTVLMDSENDNIFYIKICDNIGMCTLRTFKYEELSNVTPTPVQPTMDMSQYVTRKEFEELLKSLGGMDDGKSTISATDAGTKQSKS